MIHASHAFPGILDDRGRGQQKNRRGRQLPVTPVACRNPGFHLSRSVLRRSPARCGAESPVLFIRGLLRGRTATETLRKSVGSPKRPALPLFVADIQVRGANPLSVIQGNDGKLKFTCRVRILLRISIMKISLADVVFHRHKPGLCHLDPDAEGISAVTRPQLVSTVQELIGSSIFCFQAT